MSAAARRAVLASVTLALVVMPARPPLDHDSEQSKLGLRLELTLPSDPGLYFGGVADADVLPDGTVLVLDRLNRRLYRFSSAGQLLDSLGREGAGPGELRGPSQLEVGVDGEIIVADLLNGRLTRWTPSGQALPAIGLPGGQLVHGMWATGGGLWVETSRMGRVSTTSSWIPTTVSFYRLETSLDSLVVPRVTFPFQRDPATLATRGVSCEHCPATVTARGDVLVAAPDTVYRVAQIGDGGGVIRSWQRTGLRAVRRTAGEIEQIRKRYTRVGAPPVPFQPEFFRFKPRLASLGVDEAGRLWALRWGPEGSPTEMDVFAPDTRFLGTVSVPELVTRIVVRPGRVLGIGESPDGEPRVYLYRMAAPDGGDEGVGGR